MTAEFTSVTTGILELTEAWEPRLMAIPEEVLSGRRNIQQRTIRQILGHLADSVSNNTHRIIHLQYRDNPMEYPNYASDGNNDRWIAIQNFQAEDWSALVQYWKWMNVHIVHVINNIQIDTVDHTWVASPGRYISMREMIIGYLDHLRLHLREIEELLD
jgi:hypothetical protein